MTEAGQNTTPKVFTIVLNWNGWKDTVECIESLNKQTYKNVEVLVVDNASADNSVEEIRKHFPGIRIYQNPENRGYAGGNNAGIKIAMEEGADYIWILNNDTVAAPDALQKLVERMEGDESAGLCGVTLVYADDRNTVQAMGGGVYSKWSGTTKNLGDGLLLSKVKEAHETEKKLDFIAGASMMASRKFITETGLMHEGYFLYYEEIDWAVRAGNRFSLAYSPGSIVYHKEGASTKASRNKPGNRSITADYFQLRNRLMFTIKYHPAWLPTVYLTVWAALIKRLLKGQWERLPMILGVLFGIPSKRFKT